MIVSVLTVSSQLFGAEFDQSHSRYAKVLTKYVKNARVNYAGLKKDPTDLDAYLKAIATVRPDEFKTWSKDQQLALLLNLYNAHTLKLIINHYPLDSIRDIGLLPGAAWRIQDVRFGGQLLTLDHLEHKIIRADYDEPRIHFALVCAALSCPPLRSEPYVAAKLDAQLEEQARLFLADSSKNRFDPGTNTLWLSAIFDWYQEDFGDLKSYAADFLPEKSAEALRQADEVNVKFRDYDWSLNSQ
jgi:hypothetical protein